MIAYLPGTLYESLIEDISVQSILRMCGEMRMELCPAMYSRGNYFSIEYLKQGSVPARLRRDSNGRLTSALPRLESIPNYGLTSVWKRFHWTLTDFSPAAEHAFPFFSTICTDSLRSPADNSLNQVGVDQFDRETWIHRIILSVGAAGPYLSIIYVNTFFYKYWS